jgi:hypothetical protein
MVAALTRAAMSPYESTTTMQRRDSPSSRKNTVIAARVFPRAPETPVHEEFGDDGHRRTALYLTFS